MRAASAAFWMIPRALSATPFSSGLFAFVNSCYHPHARQPKFLEGVSSIGLTLENVYPCVPGKVVLHYHDVFLTKHRRNSLRATEIHENSSYLLCGA